MRAALSIACAIALTGCNTSDQPSRGQVQSARLIPGGFTCLTSPSTAYAPGFVYRIDSNGVENLSEDLSLIASPVRYPAALGSYEANLSGGAGLVASFVPPPGSFGSIDASASAATSRSSRVSFSSGAFLLMSDSQETELLDYINANLKFVAGNEYFVVRDTVQAEGIEIEVSAEDEAKLGGALEIQSLISAKPDFNVERFERLVVKGNFAEPLNVCIKSVQIRPVEEATSSGGPVAVSDASIWIFADRAAGPAEAESVLRAQ